MDELVLHTALLLDFCLDIFQRNQDMEITTQDLVTERILNLISTFLKVNKEKITPQSRFLDDLGADSLDHVELIMALEEEFKIEIPEADAEKFVCVQDILSYISKNSISVSEKKQPYSALHFMHLNQFIYPKTNSPKKNRHR